MTSKSFQFTDTILGNQASLTITITSFQSFPITLASDIFSPKIYAKKGEASVPFSDSDCTKNGVTLTCTPTSTQMSTDGDYEIFYENACGEQVTTGITVTKTTPPEKTTYNIEKLEITADSTCSTSAFSTILVTLDKKPSNFFEITITQQEGNKTPYTFSCNSIESTTITCTGSPVPVGTYKFTSAVSTTPDAEDFTHSSVDSTTLSYVSGLGEITVDVRTQNLKSDAPSFTVPLASSAPSSLKFYLGQNGAEITCTQADGQSVLSCPTAGMTKGQNYNIYYSNPCNTNEKLDTQITVSIEAEEEDNTIRVTDVTFDKGETCLLAPFTTIVLTLKANLPTGTNVNSVTISDGSTSKVLDDCTSSKNTVTCTTATEIATAGKYKVSAIDPSEIDIAGINKKEIELKTATPVLGKQTATKQTVNSDTPTFSIVLASESVTAPAIYPDAESSRAITCTKTTATLTCTPTATEMPTSKDYEIYYADACGKHQKTGVTVSYTVAPTKDPEIAVDDGDAGSIVMISKYVLGVLLVLLF